MSNSLLEKFGFSTKDKTKSTVQNLTAIPKKDKGENVVHTEVFKSNTTHQIDLLSLPSDHGYDKLVVVVDLASRMIGAEPIKNKDSSTVLKAVQRIYDKSKYLKKPLFIEVDQGSEFKSVFWEYWKDEGVLVKYKKTGRHRSQASVEATNHVLGKALNKYMLMTEVETGEISRQWRSVLPELIDLINDMRIKNNIKKKDKDKNKIGYLMGQGDSLKLIPIGTMVRVISEEPRNIKGEKQHGKFRAGDLRWELQPRKVVQYSLRPGEPVTYLVQGINNVAYTKNQLQIVGNEKQAPESALSKKALNIRNKNKK